MRTRLAIRSIRQTPVGCAPGLGELVMRLTPCRKRLESAFAIRSGEIMGTVDVRRRSAPKKARRMSAWRWVQEPSSSVAGLFSAEQACSVSVLQRRAMLVLRLVWARPPLTHVAASVVTA